MSKLIVALWLLACCLVWRAVPLPQLAPRFVRRRWTWLAMPWRGRLGFAVDIRLVLLTR
jgi:hypothetical protein